MYVYMCESKVRDLKKYLNIFQNKKYFKNILLDIEKHVFCLKIPRIKILSNEGKKRFNVHLSHNSG